MCGQGSGGARDVCVGAAIPRSEGERGSVLCPSVSVRPIPTGLVVRVWRRSRAEAVCVGVEVEVMHFRRGVPWGA